MFNSPFSMVVGIVLIGCIYSLVQSYIDSRKNAQPDPGQSASDETLELIAKLEHRVEVLERKVTDSGYNLKRELDQL
mgnify:CR=1 FL=1